MSRFHRLSKEIVFLIERRLDNGNLFFYYNPFTFSYWLNNSGGKTRNAERKHGEAALVEKKSYKPIHIDEVCMRIYRILSGLFLIVRYCFIVNDTKFIVCNRKMITFIFYLNFFLFFYFPWRITICYLQ